MASHPTPAKQSHLPSLFRDSLHAAVSLDYSIATLSSWEWEFKKSIHKRWWELRNQKPLSLLWYSHFPRWGLGQDSSGTPAPAILAWDSCILPWLFLQIMFPDTGFARESAVCPSSKKQEQQQWRFSDSGGIGNPQAWMRISSPERTHSVQ